MNVKLENNSNKIIIILLSLILIAIVGVLSLKLRGDKLNDANINFESKVEAFLMSNPKVVVNALEKHYQMEKVSEQKKRQEGLAKQSDSIYKDAPMIGNKNAKITLVEFFDYNCGYCKKALMTISEVVEKNPDVRVVFKDLPILGPESLLLAQASLAAFQLNPDKFFDAHLKLMSLGRGVTNDRIISELSSIGYDGAKLLKVMNSKEVRDQLNENKKVARELGINGTPAFILNDQFIDGYLDYNSLAQMIEGVK